MKVGDIIAKNVFAGSKVKDLYAKIVSINKKIILKKMKNVDLARHVYSFLPSLDEYCDTIKKYIRSYILYTKIKKWGRGIFIDTFVDADWYFYIPAFDCNLWKTYEINQDKYENENIKFEHKIVNDDYIPKGFDLIIIKDVIQHWTDEDILKYLNEILINNKFIFCTIFMIF